MFNAPSRARRTALRLFAAAAIAGTLVACDTPSAPVAPSLDAAPSLQHDTEADTTTGGSRSGFGNPHG